MPETAAEETGLCLDDFQWGELDVRFRFENTTDGHFKFYEITLTEHDAQWTLHTYYGSMKLGAHVTHRSEEFMTRRHAEDVIYENIKTRLEHGYKEVSK